MPESKTDLGRYLYMCSICGTPSTATWPGLARLPGAATMEPREKHERVLRERLRHGLENLPGRRARAQAEEFFLDMCDRLLAMDPERRCAAAVVYRG